MYAIINKEKCQSIGIDYTSRMTHGDDVAITEKELMFSSAKGDTLLDKARGVDAILVTPEEIDIWDKACKAGKDGKEVLNGRH